MPGHRSTPVPRLRLTAAVALVVGLLAGACSADPGAGPGSEDGTPTTTTTSTGQVRPPGPAAALSTELTGGAGVFLGSASEAPDLEAAGYVDHEYAATGTATSYRAEAGLPADGRFELTEEATADYRTRVVVRRPSDPARFDGTVVVEWLNVSGGLDGAPGWSYLADEVVRAGSAWVGVSAQQIGVEGGPVAVGTPAAEGIAGRGLKALDPERYGSLDHPGDAFSYDIYTQVARALRAAEEGGALGPLRPERVLAVGESQSAFALTTYVNGVQPRTAAFDGFLLHSRGGAAAPLGDDGPIDIAGAIAGEPTIVRTDTEVPVLILQTETDVVSVIGYHPARQDDTDRIRVWEVAGAAHADRFLVGPLADTVDCPTEINDGPLRFVARAALRRLDAWVRTGEAPPTAARLDVEVLDGTPVIRRTSDGIALGGVRTPPVDAPVDVLSGEPGPDPSVICLLLGSTTPIAPARLAELHGGRRAYLDAFARATEDAVAAGFVLADDREAMLAEVRPDRIPS
jgi:hypothetical protein